MAPADARRALVLFSGGQDSTTCLAWALDRYAQVETVGFDYGQRHRVELDCRPRLIEALRRDFPHWSARLGEDHLLDLALLGQVSDSALTSARAIEFAAGGLPNTFVPGRNLLVELSHSCYLGDRSRRHAWGCGCGACPACDLRRKGWEAYAVAALADDDERQ